MTLGDLFQVWSAPAIAAAVLEGLLFGYILVGRFAANPAYASGVATPREYGGLFAVMVGAGGMIFYAGQILASYVIGDQGWTRVVSRYGVWIVFSLAIGLGVWIRLRRHLARKHADAQHRAVSELADLPTVDPHDNGRNDR